ncbi:MAG: DUF1593 domain-containing protein [Planctomycetes bacterium]|nr:DUF1593 domain-containing protein [Planctomycetota bacterium]
MRRLSMLFMMVIMVALCLHGIMYASDKPRLVVLTDIGGDPDDQQSMTRLMTYSNEFDIEGMIASSQMGHGAVTAPELIKQIINSYGQIRGNLVNHTADYPTKDYLLSVVKSGNPNFGTSYIGAGKDTAGSNHIISVVDRTDSRPVNIAVWGGTTDLAQALWRVRNDRTSTHLATFIAKLKVHAIADQDNTGPWIRTNFPTLFYIKNGGVSSTTDVFRGMYQGGSTTTCSQTWVDTNIKNNHGALGAEYPNTGIWAPPENCMKEGDTPSWFYFLPKGINDSEKPGFGCWGGRFKESSGDNNHWQDTSDTYGGETYPRATVWRWRAAFNADFQARMDWCKTSSYSGANHNPVAVLNGDAGKGIIYINATAGSTVPLSANGSSDPDGNTLSYKWWQYTDADSCSAAVSIFNSTSKNASFIMPDEPGKTVHIILEIKDNGSPNLYSFRRLVATCKDSDDYPKGALVPDDFNDNSIRSDWLINGNGTATETNGQIQINIENSSSSWVGCSLTQNAKVNITSPLVYDLDVTIPDTSANQFMGMFVTPSLSFTTDGTCESYVRVSIRGSTISVNSNSGLNQTIGSVSSGQTYHLQMTIDNTNLTVKVDDIEKFSGPHLHSGLGGGVYAGFRAANKLDSAGGITKFDNFLGNDPDQPNTPPTVSIQQPAEGSTYYPGNIVNFSGNGIDAEDGALAGNSLVWQIDRIGDGLAPLQTTTGTSGTFTFPYVSVTTTLNFTLTATDSEGATTEVTNAVVLEPTPDNPNAIRIMPLGDSITQGDYNHNTYRRPLWLALAETGYEVNFVGSIDVNHKYPTDVLPPDTDFDIDHEGHWGWRADEIIANIDNWAQSADPDVVLLHIGTNDMIQGQSVSITIDEIGQIIDRLRVVNPQVKILLAQVLPSALCDVTGLNAAIPALVVQKTTADSPVVLVDHYTDFDAATELYDGTHPTEEGEQKMADRWMAALQPLLDGETPHPYPVPVIVDNTEATMEGYWTISGHNSGYYGDNYIHDGNTDKGNKSVFFMPELPESGMYTVEARWTSDTNRANNVPITIDHVDGADTITVDQTQNGGAWVMLGEYGFETSGGCVTVSNAGTSGYVIADAVRFIRTGDLPPNDDTPSSVIIDNTGATLEGAWTSSTYTSGYYDTNYIHDGNTDKGNKSALFMPELPESGMYTVEARWTSGTNRATNVPITIDHINGSETVIVDQTQNGGLWVTLGEYGFESSGGCVTVSNTGTSAYVIADAVRFTRTGDLLPNDDMPLEVSNIYVASGKSYETATFATDEKCYIDRAYTFTSTAGLDGAVLIRTANDDKAAGGDSFISFSVNTFAMVYVAYDSRATELPDWLSTWENTGLVISTSDVSRNIYSKTFSAGTVTLGGCNAGSMYNVIVK